MKNVYSCGCSAYDVPIISSCKEHGGNVVSATRNVVMQEDRRSFITKNKKLALLYDNPHTGLGRLKPESVGLIWSYPDHFDFLVRTLLEPSAFRTYNDRYFSACRRVLRPNGHIVLFVEVSALIAVVYSAMLSGFKVVSQSSVIMRLDDDSNEHRFLNNQKRHKVCVVFAFNGHHSTADLSSVNPSRCAQDIIDIYQDGLIVDTSCIHNPFPLVARKVAKTVGIVNDTSRYVAMKRRAKGRKKS